MRSGSGALSTRGTNLSSVKMAWKLSQLFIEIWSFETIRCLNFNTQRQKRHAVTHDVKVNFLICGFVILFFIILSMCEMECAEKLTLIHFCLEFA